MENDLLLDEPRLHLCALLGRGGMGSVWTARYDGAPTDVAVKVTLAGHVSDDARARLRREARALALAAGPQVVRLLSDRTSAPTPFLVMEKLEGAPLSAHTTPTSRLPLDEIRAVLVQLGWGLGRLHAAGIIHADVKGDNVVLVRNGGAPEPVLIDFGVARTKGEEPLDSDAQPAGTPRHMPPEQALEPMRPTQRWDTWALAVLAYQLLTGRTPFEADDVGSILCRALAGEYVAPSAWVSTLTPEVDAVFAEAFAAEPDASYASVGGFVHALVTALAEVASFPEGAEHASATTVRPRGPRATRVSALAPTRLHREMVIA
ncbi:MAG: serine/threonine-protein kinase [Polyangiaceae bacterium]